MAHTKRALPKALPLGDAVVDGLLSGVAAGVLMSIYLVLTGLVQGVGPAATLGHFAAGGSASPLTGALVQMAVAGVYGALFGGLASIISHRWHVRPPRVWFAGAAYGLILLLVAQFSILPATPSLAGIPPVQFAVAHLIYGVLLGFLFDRGSHL